MALIHAENLGKVFESRRNRETTVFKNFNLQLEPREFVTLLGPSGCGKSTLLRILGGLEKASEGSLERKFQSGSFVFQEPRLLPWKTCLENVLLPLEIKNSKVSQADHGKAKELLKLMKLEKFESHFPAELSGGMKMRNALARSLILNPDFLLLDEPFSALDETTRLFLQVEIRNLFETKPWTFCFVTHSIEEACFLSSRILIFSKDRNQLIEHKSNLPNKRKESLRDELAFFEEVKKVRHLFQTEALS
ncbi:MAG: ABC transporter ATP-binding protein [Pseudobdellovibrionaceae bacterium]